MVNRNDTRERTCPSQTELVTRNPSKRPVMMNGRETVFGGGVQPPSVVLLLCGRFGLLRSDVQNLLRWMARECLEAAREEGRREEEAALSLRDVDMGA